MACAESPIRATLLPSFQGKQRVITKLDTGWVFQSFNRLGSKGIDVGEVLFEKGLNRVICRQMVQPILAFVGPKQRARERLVRVGQGHQHEVATRPDVQAVGLHLEVAVVARQHGHLFVAVGQVSLLKVKAVVSRHAAADGAESPVRSKQAIHRHVQGRALAFQVQRHAGVAAGVAQASVVKFKPNVGHGLGAFHKDAVESGARHRVDALPFHAVGLVGPGAVDGVHAAAGDGQRNLTHRVGHPRPIPGLSTHGRSTRG